MTADDPRPPDPEVPDAPEGAVPHGPTPNPGVPPSGTDTRASDVSRTTTGESTDDPRTRSAADEVDELASALVDGEMGAGDAARHRPDVVARAAELETARAALRDVPSADPAVRDQALAAALAAYDDRSPAVSSRVSSPVADALRPPPPAAGHGRVPAPPVDLAAHARSRRSARPAGRSGLPRWFGAAAAAVAVLAGLVGLAAVSSGGDDADTATNTGAAETHESSDGAGGSAAEDTAEAPAAAPDEGGAQRSAVEAGDLGVFMTGDALVDHLRESLGEGADADVQTEADAPFDADGGAVDVFASCAGAPPPPLDDPAAPRVLHGRAVVDGAAVDVWAIDTARGRRVVAIDAACELVLDRPLR